MENPHLVSTWREDPHLGPAWTAELHLGSTQAELLSLKSIWAEEHHFHRGLLSVRVEEICQLRSVTTILKPKKLHSDDGKSSWTDYLVQFKITSTWIGGPEGDGSSYQFRGICPWCPVWNKWGRLLDLWPTCRQAAWTHTGNQQARMESLPYHWWGHLQPQAPLTPSNWGALYRGRGSPVMRWILLSPTTDSRHQGWALKFFRFKRNAYHLWTAIIWHRLNYITHQQVMRFNEGSKFANIFKSI